ncbi:hypothetical protein C2845_PM06G29340 [Panicum miliaceum]|uniref:Uncharacterized protein n=1 Tax=Panicum miliaceum TaxID=4540 RepID=A0A3L6R7F3_PANMI|nr:hypothetical protein C2845_PM06G29340 [Panicum miliaceum]
MALAELQHNCPGLETKCIEFIAGRVQTSRGEQPLDPIVGQTGCPVWHGMACSPGTTLGCIESCRLEIDTPRQQHRAKRGGRRWGGVVRHAARSRAGRLAVAAHMREGHGWWWRRQRRGEASGGRSKNTGCGELGNKEGKKGRGAARLALGRQVRAGGS